MVLPRLDEEQLGEGAGADHVEGVDDGIEGIDAIRGADAVRDRNPRGAGGPRIGALGFDDRQLPIANNAVGMNGLERADEEANRRIFDAFNAQNVNAPPQRVGKGAGPGGGKPAGGGAQPKFEPPPPKSPTRMGVGPGGPAMNYDEAYSMLNAPANIGQVQEAISGVESAGAAEVDRFRQAAGDPAEFGKRERSIISSALEPFAEGQEREKEQAYEAARDVLQRSYKGPTSSEELQKATGVARAAKTAAESMGTGAGRAALHELRGLTPGQAKAEAARQFDAPGYARGVRQTGAKAASTAARLGQEHEKTAQIGAERTAQAASAGAAARADTGVRGANILTRATERAKDKNIAIADAQDAYEMFVNYGNAEGLGGQINMRVMQGYDTRGEAMRTWTQHWSKPEYASISELPPMQWAMDGRGNPILNWSNEAIDKIEEKMAAAKETAPPELYDRNDNFIFTPENRDAWGEWINSPDFYAPVLADADLISTMRPGGRYTRQGRGVDHPSPGGQGEWLDMMIAQSQGHTWGGRYGPNNPPAGPAQHMREGNLGDPRQGEITQHFLRTIGAQGLLQETSLVMRRQRALEQDFMGDMGRITAEWGFNQSAPGDEGMGWDRTPVGGRMPGNVNRGRAGAETWGPEGHRRPHHATWLDDPRALDPFLESSGSMFDRFSERIGGRRNPEGPDWQAAGDPNALMGFGGESVSARLAGLEGADPRIIANVFNRGHNLAYGDPGVIFSPYGGGDPKGLDQSYDTHVGRFSDIMPLYGAASQAYHAPNLADTAEQYIAAPTGTASMQSELTADEARRYNLIQQMIGAAPGGMAGGTPVSQELDIDLAKWREANQEYSDLARTNVEEQTQDFLARTRAAGTTNAGNWFLDDQSGIRGPLTDEDWALRETLEEPEEEVA